MLDISPHTAMIDYKMFLYIKKSMMCERYVRKDIEGVTRHLSELEELKERAYKSLSACEEGTPSHVATMKVITDTLNQIKNIKIAVGLWTEDMFQGDVERETIEKIKNIKIAVGLWTEDMFQGDVERETIESKIIEMRKKRGLDLPQLPEKTSEKKETLNIADKIDNIKDI
jgi:hypothetical protein